MQPNVQQEVLKFKNIFTLAGFTEEEAPIAEGYEYFYKVGIYTQCLMGNDTYSSPVITAIVHKVYSKFENDEVDQYDYTNPTETLYQTLTIKKPHQAHLRCYQQPIKEQDADVTINDFLSENNMLWNSANKMSVVFKSDNDANIFKRNYLDKLVAQTKVSLYYKIDSILIVGSTNRGSQFALYLL